MIYGLTPRQRDCLKAIHRLTVDGVPPTYEELGRKLGIASKSGVHRLVHGLRERGLVDFRAGAARSIRVRAPEVDLADLNRMGDEQLRAVIAQAYEILARRRGQRA